MSEETNHSTGDKPAVPSNRLDQLVRCSDYNAGICDNPKVFSDYAGFPTVLWGANWYADKLPQICPHSVPHIAFKGCDDQEAGCPFFAPMAGPCVCRPIETPNDKAHRPAKAGERN